MKMAPPLDKGDFREVTKRRPTHPGAARHPWGCEKIRNLWETRREGTPPPMIRKELRALLEARCPHRANFFTAPLPRRGSAKRRGRLVSAPKNPLKSPLVQGRTIVLLSPLRRA